MTLYIYSEERELQVARKWNYSRRRRSEAESRNQRPMNIKAKGSRRSLSRASKQSQSTSADITSPSSAKALRRRSPTSSLSRSHSASAPVQFTFTLRYSIYNGEFNDVFYSTKTDLWKPSKPSKTDCILIKIVIHLISLADWIDPILVNRIPSYHFEVWFH